MENYYETLGVTETAKNQEMEEALQRHSTLFALQKISASEFDAVCEAYCVLSNEEARKKYDLGGYHPDIVEKTEFTEEDYARLSERIKNSPKELKKLSEQHSQICEKHMAVLTEYRQACQKSSEMCKDFKEAHQNYKLGQVDKSTLEEKLLVINTYKKHCEELKKRSHEINTEFKQVYHKLQETQEFYGAKSLRKDLSFLKVLSGVAGLTAAAMMYATYEILKKGEEIDTPLFYVVLLAVGLPIMGKFVLGAWKENKAKLSELEKELIKKI